MNENLPIAVVISNDICEIEVEVDYPIFYYNNNYSNTDIFINKLKNIIYLFFFLILFYCVIYIYIF